jgi:hypothetical protein
MSKPRGPRRYVRGSILQAIVLAVVVAVFTGAAAATNGKVLLVGPTTWPGLVPDPLAPPGGGGEGSGGTPPGVSVEQAEAELMGKGVDLVDAAAFAGMTTDQISQYDALVMGDPGCGVHQAPAAATATRAAWGPAISGNVFVLGAAPVYAYVGAGVLDPRAIWLVDAGLAFATADAGHTGAYIDLSCYYATASPGTQVDLLDPFGSFTVSGACASDAHLLLGDPAPPPFDLLSDYALSNWWRCSSYETFDSAPSSFDVIATAGGAPYILARGAGAGSPSDTTAPAITVTTPPDGATYDLNQVVTADYACADDGGSGLATCVGTVATGAPIDTSTAGSHPFSVSASDNAGNVFAVTQTYSVAPDTVAPTITLTTPRDGAVYVQHQIVAADYACSDTGGSGLASCIGDVASGAAIDTSVLGPHTLTVMAFDNAGNGSSQTSGYTVVVPVPPERCGVTGAARLGRAISFKLEVTGAPRPSGSIEFSDRSTRHAFRGRPASVSCDGSNATISGNGSDNGGRLVPFVITVHDGGAGGRDTFSIAWPGYAASGQVTEGDLSVRLGRGGGD